MSTSSLHIAAYDGDIATVRRLLSNCTPVDERDKSGYTPLLWSCLRGIIGDQLETARALLAAGADPNAVTSKGESTALMLACQSGNADLVSLLIASGADPNGAADGVTPLMVVARKGNRPLVEILLSLGADASKGHGAFTPAHYADHGGHEDLAEFLRTVM